MNTPDKRIRVLIVDDSALVREILSGILGADPAIEVVGVAANAHIAREKIKKFNPDVLTLDVAMPRMDGLTFLQNLMRLRPMPVVMVSSLTDRNAEAAFDALALGAVDFVAKPRSDVAATLQDYQDELIAKIKLAAQVNVRALDTRRLAALRTRPVTAPVAAAAGTPDAGKQKRAGVRARAGELIVAMGASTGGTEAIKEVLCGLPSDFPAVLVSQHIPPAFSASFARRMNEVSALKCCEAYDTQPVLPGHVYIAPGNFHLRLARSGNRHLCRVTQDAHVNRHRPSVDALFQSVAQYAGPNAIGVLLTGMGRDGAMGLKAMRNAGSPTLVQDEATSVVWGMPREALELGAAGDVLPIESIAGRIMALVTAMDPAKRVSSSG